MSRVATDTEVRSKRFEQRRAKMIDIAAEVFATRGYHATTLSDLEDATGMKRGGVYHYLKSKQDALAEIHRRFVEPVMQDARQILVSPATPSDQLVQIAVMMMSYVENYQAHGTVFLREWRALVDHESWPEVRANRDGFEDIVLLIMERGVSDGSLTIPDPDIALRAFLGMINSAYTWYRPDGRLDSAAVGARLAHYFIEGVRTHD